VVPDAEQSKEQGSKLSDIILDPKKSEEPMPELSDDKSDSEPGNE
jgi:hypothetical protein